MGQLDDYARGQVQPHLRPGEVIQTTAFASRPTRFNVAGLAKEWLPCLMVVTDQRLVFIECNNYPGEHAAKWARAENHGSQIWELADLAEVGHEYIGAFYEAHTMTLKPHPGRGPLAEGKTQQRYDFFESMKGFDDQERVFNEFVPWLQGQVQQRAFGEPSPNPGPTSLPAPEPVAGLAGITPGANKHQTFLAENLPSLLWQGEEVVRSGIAISIGSWLVSMLPFMGMTRKFFYTVLTNQRLILIQTKSRWLPFIGQHPVPGNNGVQSLELSQLEAADASRQAPIHMILGWRGFAVRFANEAKPIKLLFKRAMKGLPDQSHLVKAFHGEVQQAARAALPPG